MSELRFEEEEMQERIHIVEGVIKEGDIVGIAGYYGQCKSPLMKQIAYCVSTGNRLMGRRTSKRPVTLIDMETSKQHTWKSFKGLVERYGDHPTSEYLDLYIRRAGPNDLAANQLNAVLAESSRRHIKSKEPQIDFLRKILEQKPDSLLIIDPMQAYMNLNKLNEKDITMLIGEMRGLLRHYPRAAIVTVWNLRKRDKKTRRTDPVRNIRDHMDEVSGSGDIINRTDTRLICGEYPDRKGVYVLNGIVRDQEKFAPLLFRKCLLDEEGVEDIENLAGFREVEEKDVKLSMGQKLLAAKLPWTFRITQKGKDINIWSETREGPLSVPKASFYRMVHKLMLMGWLEEVGEREFVRKV